MKLLYAPASRLEHFGQKIYNLLVENFSRTFYVGGMVRDILLEKKITDIDIATAALPGEVANILKSNNIKFDPRGIKFGVVTTQEKDLRVEVATFREEFYQGSRYPAVNFIKNPQHDSLRRDFTINSLYLSAKTNKIFDYHKGLLDIKDKRIRFIGNPNERIFQDPLRMIRAIRFVLDLNFKLAFSSYISIKENLFLIKKISKKRAWSEIEKTKSAKNKKALIKILTSPAFLDIYINKS